MLGEHNKCLTIQFSPKCIIFEIHIFENYTFKQIPNFIKMTLILKNMHLRENWSERHLTYCARLIA